MIVVKHCSKSQGHNFWTTWNNILEFSDTLIFFLEFLNTIKNIVIKLSFTGSTIGVRRTTFQVVRCQILPHLYPLFRLRHFGQFDCHFSHFGRRFVASTYRSRWQNCIWPDHLHLGTVSSLWCWITAMFSLAASWGWRK